MHPLAACCRPCVPGRPGTGRTGRLVSVQVAPEFVLSARPQSVPTKMVMLPGVPTGSMAIL